MEKKFYIVIATFLLGCVVFSSCKKDETTDSPVTIVENRVIETKVLLDNIWEENISSKDGESSSNPKFMCYLFDPSGLCLRNRGGSMDDDMTVQFEDATTAGEHSIYAVTGWQSMPTITSIDLNTTQLPLYPNRDITLGCTTFTIVAGTMDYDVQVVTNHIMAKLALTIRYVPSHINSITVTLPNQGNTFKFDGTIEGNTQTQTFTLTKGTTPNENGSYDWTLAETIVLPCAAGTTSMPITIVAESSFNTTRTIQTTSSICCLSTTRTSLSATWDAFFNSTTVTINPWTGTIQTGEFEI